MEDQEFINQLAEKLSKLGTVRPLGFHYLHPYGTVPADSIICNGATYSRALYKDFFDYITTQGWVKTEAEWQEIANRDNGFCPFYSSGDGSTNFRTPKFAPYQQIALASGSVGKYHQAGLPNSEGWFKLGSPAYYGDHNTSGMCTRSEEESVDKWGGLGDGAWRHGRTYKVSLKDGNPIYGRSDTVQTESHEWVMCVVAYGIATNVGSVDIQNVMSAVNAVQAQVGEIPKPKAYITETWHSGTSWYRKWSDGWIEQGGYNEGGSDYGDSTVTLPTSFAGTNYSVFVQNWNGNWDYSSAVISRTNSSYFIRTRFGKNFHWHACGY